MIRNYFKIAYRNLVNNKVYSCINIGGLSIGMATTVLIFLWVQNEYSFDAYHKKSDNIYRINTILKIDDLETWYWASTPFKLAEHLNENFTDVVKSTRLFTPWSEFEYSINNEIYSCKNVAFVDKNWFDVFDYQFIRGNVEIIKNDIFSMIISENKANELFPKQNPIGKIIKHDSLLYVIGGVVKNSPSNSSFQFDFIFNNESRMSNPIIANNDEQWSNFNYQTFMLSNTMLNPSTTSDKLTKLLKKSRNSDDENTKLEIQKLTDIHFDSTFKSTGLAAIGDKTIVNIIALIAIFILLIACSNYVNLTTAKASQRFKEISIKKMIGATRSSLFYQFLLESFLSSFIAAILSLALLYFGLGLLNDITESNFSFQNNPKVLYMLAGTAIVSVFLTGIYPSLFLASFQPIQTIKGELGFITKNGDLRKGLVVFQFTVTMVLLISTMLIFRQLKYIHNKPLGYEKEQIFTITVPWNIPNSASVLKTLFEKLKTESSLKDVSLSNASIVNVLTTHSGSLKWAGKDTTWTPTTTLMNVGPNYRDFFKLQLSDGRWLNESKSDENNYILNETAIKDFKIPKPWIGQTFEIHGRKGSIVGIVKDFHFKSLKEAISPIVLFHDPESMNTINVKVHSGQYKKAVEICNTHWKVLAPNHFMNYQFLDNEFNILHKKESKQLEMFNAFAVIVLLISCLGLFGLATFSTEVRTKEIGIRKVMGASLANILNLISKDFFILVGVSIILASPIAWWAMDKWLQQFAYHINFDFFSWFLVSGFLVLITLFTIGFQAIKAALMNPVKSLRSE